MRYRVIKPFTYDGTQFQRDAHWVPKGLRGDEAILRARFVVPLIEVIDEADQIEEVSLATAVRSRGRRSREVAL